MQPYRSPPAWLRFVTALAVVAGVYTNALSAPFLSDDWLILDHPEVRSLQPLWSYIRPVFSDRTSETRFFRPFALLSFAVDHHFFGANATCFHLVNILGHLLNMVLLWMLMRRLGARAFDATLASLVWALFPRLTEAVTWVSGRMDVFATTCTLIALLLWTRNRRVSRVGAACALFAGLLFKEVAIAGVLAIVTFEFTRGRRRVQVARLLPVGIALGAYLLLRQAGLRGIQAYSHQEPILSHLRRIACAAGAYATMLIHPFSPRMVVAMREGDNLTLAWAGVVVILGLSVLGICFLRRGTRAQLVMGAVCMGSILPVMQIIPIYSFALVSDRYLYLPLAGALAVIAISARSWSVNTRRGALFFGSIMAVAGGVFTFARNEEMGSALRFWANEARRSGLDDPSGYDTLATTLHDMRKPELAVRAYELALPRTAWMEQDTVFPIGIRVRFAQTLASMGRVEDAASILREVIVRQPDLPDHLRDLALTRTIALDFEGARAIVRGAPASLKQSPVLVRTVEEITARERAAADLDHAGADVAPWARAAKFEISGAFSAAIDAYAALLRAHTSRPPVWVRRAVLMIFEHGDSESMRIALDAARRAQFGAPQQATLEHLLDIQVSSERDIDWVQRCALSPRRDAQSCSRLVW